MFTIFDEPSNHRRRLVFYLTTTDAESDIVVESIKTVADDGNGFTVEDNEKVAVLLNDDKKDTKFKTAIAFRYDVTNEKTPFTKMIEYILPRLKHELVVNTPGGDMIQEYDENTIQELMKKVKESMKEKETKEKEEKK